MSIHEHCQTFDKIAEQLDIAAKNFILREEGERKAENPYRDLIDNSQITEDGYFLRHVEKGIDVCMRKTVVIPGRLWNTIDIQFTIARIFRWTESNITLIAPKAEPIITEYTPLIPSKLGKISTTATYYNELCDILRKRREATEIDACFNQIIRDSADIIEHVTKRRQHICDTEEEFVQIIDTVDDAVVVNDVEYGIEESETFSEYTESTIDESETFSESEHEVSPPSTESESSSEYSESESENIFDYYANVDSVYDFNIEPLPLLPPSDKKIL